MTDLAQRLASMPTPRYEAFNALLDRSYPSGFDKDSGRFRSWPEEFQRIERENTLLREVIVALRAGEPVQAEQFAAEVLALLEAK